jgi:protocatechuate 3,4-dioxygenase beta subunit
VPGLYPGRTRHYHLKVQKPGGSLLTTQLDFPGELANDRDGLFDPALLLDISAARDGKLGRYDFVVA